MSAPIVAPPLAGSVLGSIGDSFIVAEWKDAGGPTPGPPRWIAPLHLHRNDDEAWYVLEGTLCVRSGADVIEAQAGSGVLVARGTPHTYWNPGPAPTRYLLVMTSNIYGLIKAIHALPERTPAALRAVFSKYDAELLE
jgi:oxalate decarboxylase/phosphoglucose isomerase-like protein (cupin superfamily)